MSEEKIREFSSMEKLEQYKAYLRDLENIGSRSETARGFFLSVLSALLALLTVLTSHSGDSNQSIYFIIIGIGGCAICVLWAIHTLSFSAIFSAKLGVIEELEKDFPYHVFRLEFARLKKDWRYIRLTYVECCVALVFFILFMVTMILIVNRNVG
ncbi:hypothetical protein ACFL2V_19420 [Pseudomonadota bacterium]